MGKKIKEITCLEINLTKEVQYLFPENYKILLKLKKSYITGKTYSAHGLEDLILLDGSTGQSSLKIQCYYYQNLNDYFAEMERLILKSRWNLKEPWVAKTILKKKDKVPNFITYYKAAVKEWGIGIRINQQKSIESSGVNPYIYHQLFLKSVPRLFSKRRLTSTNGAGTTWYPHAKAWSWTLAS